MPHVGIERLADPVTHQHHRAECQEGESSVFGMMKNSTAYQRVDGKQDGRGYAR